MVDTAYLSVLLLLVYTIYVVRLISILPFFKRYSNGEDKAISEDAPFEYRRKGPLHVFVFLGSGGHTGEMLRILENYKKVLLSEGTTVYVGFSDLKSRDSFRAQIQSNHTSCKYEYYRFMKAREVNSNVWQSLNSISKTLFTSFQNVAKVSKKMGDEPHLVLLNGPGTCCVIATWFKMIEWINLLQPSLNIVYVESLARINSLSLTGKVLYWLADIFVVQWQELTLNNPRAKFFGILV